MNLGRAGSVSVVVPVYNEKENLDVLHREIRTVMEETGLPWELVLVDDGSTDGSGEDLERRAAADPVVRVLRLERNAGQSAALAAGFAAAAGEVIVTLDADLQNDPGDIPRLLSALPGHGAVIGWRQRRHDSWVRRLSSRIANGVRNAVTRETVTDTGCSLKVMRREALSHLPAFRGMHRFLPTFIKMNGYPVTELPVNHRPRRAGESKYGIGNRLWVGIGDLFMVRWLQGRRFSYRVGGECGRGLRPAGGSSKGVVR
jgi:glycosyltransferase involved in cell wall biosynthesis